MNATSLTRTETSVGLILQINAPGIAAGEQGRSAFLRGAAPITPPAPPRTDEIA